MWQGKHDRTRRAKLTDAEADAARWVLADLNEGRLKYAGKGGREGSLLLFGLGCRALHKALAGVEVTDLTVRYIRKGLRRVDRLPPPVAP